MELLTKQLVPDTIWIIKIYKDNSNHIRQH